ncbi:MAG TPA: endonuclease III [Geobacterales bacterium]|nr:endonuclease III [Geobacterales bacterium]
MKGEEIHEAMAILAELMPGWRTPAVTIVSQRQGDPFKVLISCILSLRTRDETTGPASERLFAVADTPEALARLRPAVIEQLIYPVGFYRNKAISIIRISQQLIDHFGSRVPDDLDLLLTLPGVGRKTANLVMTLGFNKLAICVDTHVHRICNRWGYVSTKNPEQTEMALRGQLPKPYWPVINDYLVTFGQNHCTPLSPHCSTCRLAHLCDRVGVTRSR